MADWNKRGILACIAIGAAMIGGWALWGCEAKTTLRPEVAEAAGITAPPGKAPEVELSAVPTVMYAYEKALARKAADEKAKAEQLAAAEKAKAAQAADDAAKQAAAERAKADEAAAQAAYRINTAGKLTAREIRRLQEQLEDGAATENAKAAAALAAAQKAIEAAQADAARALAASNARLDAIAAELARKLADNAAKADIELKMQAVEVQAAERRQAIYDQITQFGLGAANTAAATQAGTPWGGLLMGALGIAGAAFGVKQRGEAKRANSALDAVTSGIEEAHKAGLDAAVLKAVKAEIAKQAQPGDITTIETSIARQNYEAKV